MSMVLSTVSTVKHLHKNGCQSAKVSKDLVVRADEEDGMSP